MITFAIVLAAPVVFSGSRIVVVRIRVRAAVDHSCCACPDNVGVRVVVVRVHVHAASDCRHDSSLCVVKRVSSGDNPFCEEHRCEMVTVIERPGFNLGDRSQIGAGDMDARER